MSGCAYACVDVRACTRERARMIACFFLRVRARLRLIFPELVLASADVNFLPCNPWKLGSNPERGVPPMVDTISRSPAMIGLLQRSKQIRSKATLRIKD